MEILPALEIDFESEICFRRLWLPGRKVTSALMPKAYQSQNEKGIEVLELCYLIPDFRPVAA